MKRFEESPAGVGPTSFPIRINAHGFEPRRTEIAPFQTAKLPNNPIARLDKAVRRFKNLRRLVNRFEQFREKPLARVLASVSFQERLAPLFSDRIDVICFGLSGVVLPLGGG